MAPNTRGRQATADPDSEESGGETGGELVSHTATLSTYFPGLSHETSGSLTSWMEATMNARDTRLEQRISAQISAQIATANKPIMDLLAAISARLSPEQQQITAPLDPQLVITPPLQPPQIQPPPNQPTQPAPQEAQKEEDQQPLQPLYQATVEDDTENTAESITGSTIPDSKSTLSSMPCLCATRSPGDSAACFSNARLFARRASCLASFLTSLFGNYLTSFFGFASPLGYIRCMEGMEATGQG